MIDLSKRNTCFLLNLVLIVVLLFQPTVVQAHAPAIMNLSYDYDTEELVVGVGHAVSDPATHHISLIEIYVDGDFRTSRTYYEQDSVDGLTDYFDVPAEMGAVIRVTANCSESGQIMEELTVTSIATDGVDDPTTPDPTTFVLTEQMITAIWVLTGLAVCVVVILVIVGHKKGII